jgi:hypothetical protein
MRSLRGFVSEMAGRLPFAALAQRLLPRGQTDGLEPSVYGFILRYSWREQVYVVVMTLLSFAFL